ncbi:MAG: endonuclease III [Syntrophomonadaceae bacterium]|nr:endonuclease III [Syntrophomonadaceae bacterium]
MDQDLALKIYNKLKETYPDAKTRLEYGSLFELLIAVVLSAQSTDNQVNKVTKELFKEYDTPEKIAAMDIKDLEEKIKGVGLFRTKAKNIKELVRIIIEKHNGMVPEKFDELLKLPGVGRKTANVIVAVGFNRPGLGVDTHVQRVVNRIGLVSAKNPEKTEMSLKEIIPEKLWGEAHHIFIAHGREICKARNPSCQECIINEECRKIIN